LWRSAFFWIGIALMILAVSSIELTVDWEETLANPEHAQNLHQNIFGWAASPGDVYGFVWMFISMIASVDILRDLRHHSLDLQSITPLSDARRFLGMISSYMLLSLALWLICTIAFYIVYIIHAAGRVEQVYSYGAMLGMTLQRYVFVSIPTLSIYLGVSVFTAVFTKSSAAGIVSAIVLQFTWYIPGVVKRIDGFGYNIFDIETFFGKYIYQPSAGISNFWLFHDILNQKEELKGLQMYPFAERDFVLSEIITLTVTAVLLTLAYFRWHKLHDV